MQKLKTAIIVFLLLVLIAGAVGVYYFFLAPNVPTEDIPSGAITSGDITSGEDIGSGSVDVTDVPEEQAIVVEVNNFYLTTNQDDNAGINVIVSSDTGALLIEKIAKDGYADIEIVLKDFEAEELHWYILENSIFDEIFVDEQDCTSATLRISEYGMFSELDTGVYIYIDENESINFLAFLLLTSDLPFVVV